MRQVIYCFIVVAAQTLGLYTRTACAEAIISAPSVVAQAGSSGSFEILIQSSPPPIPAVQAFSFDIFTSTPLVDFTGASTTTTVPYILDNDSFVEINGFPLATNTGQELIASDLSNDGSAFDIFPGSTFSLGTVFYSVAPSAASGPVTIFFRASGTSVAEPGGSVPTVALNGEISIVAVPEPLQIPLLLGSLPLILLASRGMQRRKQLNPSTPDCASSRRNLPTS